MALLTVNGGLETLADGTQRVVASNTGAWTDLTTWDSWNSYTFSPNTLNWLTEPLDLGRIDYFTLQITADCVGAVTYTVYVSSTGAFAGEETSTVINDGDTDIAGFYGQFVIIGITVESEGLTPAINAFDFVASGERLTVTLNDVSSGSLAGTDAARTLSIPLTLSVITNIQITPHLSESYLASEYVADGYFETGEPVVGAIVNKSRDNPQIVLKTFSGANSAGIFDAVVYGLPRQDRLGQNVILR